MAFSVAIAFAVRLLLVLLFLGFAVAVRNIYRISSERPE